MFPISIWNWTLPSHTLAWQPCGINHRRTEQIKIFAKFESRIYVEFLPGVALEIAVVIAQATYT